MNFSNIFRNILILLIFINNQSYASEKNSFFIGHAYGYHGNKDIPDKSLKNFLETTPAEFIIFGGDMTQNSKDFDLFDKFFEDTSYLAVRGNHDGDLFSKIPFWKNKNINGKKFLNLDMNDDMKFDFQILANKNDTFIIQHYLWFLRLFSDSPRNVSNKTLKEKIVFKIKSFFFLELPLVNSMYSSIILEKKQIEDINFGNNNVYLAGDCGAFQGQFTYSKTLFKGNTFICSGIGSKWANNVVNLKTLNPIFFNEKGKIVKHSCKKIKGSLKNIIELCLPNHKNSKKLWKLLK
tara:strand:- start:544 stop:1422 length:879 start_codon:yes stop_codon:yes gene_type:complete